MKKLYVSLFIAALTTTACGQKAVVTETWFSVDDYSLEINSDDQGTKISATPSLWVNPADSTFKSSLELVIHYPSADERLDIGLISIFSSQKPEVDLPDIKVELSYMFLSERPETDSDEDGEAVENPLENEDNWKNIGTYSLKPGKEKKIKIAGAASHRIVMIRSMIYVDGEEEPVVKYTHGFELEQE